MKNRFRIVFAILVLALLQGAAIARDLYGYIRFASGIAPIVGCSVRLTGPGVDRWTRGYWHPFAPTSLRYHFNGVPAGRTYVVSVFPDALYRSGSRSFWMGFGVTDFKVPDIILSL